MNEKDQLSLSIKCVIAQHRGCTLTRAAMRKTGKKFVLAMQNAGTKVPTNVHQITDDHLRIYLDFRRCLQVQIRTLQNELAHVRWMRQFVANTATGHATASPNTVSAVLLGEDDVDGGTDT